MKRLRDYEMRVAEVEVVELRRWRTTKVRRWKEGREGWVGWAEWVVLGVKRGVVTVRKGEGEWTVFELEKK